MFLESCVGSGLCDRLITPSEESCQLCVSVCDLTTSLRQPRPDFGCHATEKKILSGTKIGFGCLLIKAKISEIQFRC